MKTNWLINHGPPGGFAWRAATEVPDRRLEAVIDEPNFKSIWWLEKAITLARSVARVRLPAGSATGFLVSDDIFMTNNHVFENTADAKAARLQFNYRLLADGSAAQVDEWRCDPDSLFKTDPQLDYSIVRVQQKNGVKVGSKWGHLSLRNGARVLVGQRVNIVQHPNGRFQEIAFRANQVMAVEDSIVQYITDTDYGTSGAPVCDDWFNVVALHNQRVPDPNDPHRWYRNQGTAIQAILEHVGGAIP